MREHDCFDNLLDALIDEAAILALEDLSKELPAYDDIDPSEELDTKMQKLFQKETRQHRWNNFKGYSRRAAVFLLVLISVSAVSVLSVKAWRIRFLNFVLDTTPTNTKIEFEEDVKNNIYSSEEITLEYIPEGFALEQSSASNGHLFLMFSDGDAYFYFDVDTIGGNTRIDTENAKTKKTKVNNMEAFYSSNSNVNILVWHNNEKIFGISGNILEEEIMKIAENTIY